MKLENIRENNYVHGIVWKIRIDQALESLKKIELLLHRFRFSGPYTEFQLEERLDGKIVRNPKYKKNLRMPNYRTMACRKHHGLDLTFFLDPIKGMDLPQCLIEVSYPTQGYLICLNTLLPGLKVSSAEYTADLFCEGENNVRNFFEVLLRYCYVPNAKETNIYNGFSRCHSPSSKYNRTAYWGDYTKAYERGEDSKKKKNRGWLKNSCDRVRMEFTARKDLLKRKNIYELDNFVRDCKFNEIFSKRFNFKVFVGSGQLPKEIVSYTLIQGHEIFQEEYIRAKTKKIKNRYQYVSDVKPLCNLKKEINELAIGFDGKWRQRLKT
jgi:hypothetical protein